MREFLKELTKFLNLDKSQQEPFPPKISFWRKVILFFVYLFGVVDVAYLIDQFCIGEFFPSSVCGTYIALSLLLTFIIIDRLIRHKLIDHKARLVDRSAVEALFVEAKTVEPRLKEPELPDKFVDKKKELLDEIDRLEEFGHKGWTEYQTLSLSQMLVDFLKIDDLKARALSTLTDLEEYVDDSAYRIDQQLFYHWEGRVNDAIDEIDKIKKDKSPKKIDDVAERLRAELRTLLEDLASYQETWAKGSVVIRALTVTGIMSIPILLTMGLLPLLHPLRDWFLGIFNWGLLGISGAITAVLLSLRNSVLVEVGSTEGKKELRRALLGTGLGLVAGILLYSMIAGGILDGTAFPEITSVQPKKPLIDQLPSDIVNIALSIFWGLASGFSFEWVFDRVRSTTVRESR